MKLRCISVLGGAVCALIMQATLGTVAHAAPATLRSAPAAEVPASYLLVARAPAAGPYARGVDALRKGRYADAAKAFTAAIEQHDNVAAAYAGLGEAELAQRHYPAALRAYKATVARMPHNSLYQYRAAYAALYANDFHAAVQYASNYIRLRPRDPSGYRLRFLAYGGLRDRKNQARDAKVVARMQPHNASAQNDLGIALANNQQYGDAERAFTAAISLDRNNGLYYKNRGVTESLDKKYALAIQDLKKARSLIKEPTTRKNLDIVIASLEKQLHH